MREVGDRDHDWRCGSAFLFPPLSGLVPVVAQDGVGRIHEIGKGNVSFDLLIEIVFNGWVRVNVIQAGLEIFSELRIIANNDARRLHQPGFDGVIETEIADDPIEESFIPAALAGGRKGRGRKVEAGQNAASSMDAVESANPFGRLLDIFLCYSLDRGFGSDAPGVVGFIVNDHDVFGAGHVGEHFANVGFVAESAAFVHGPPFGNALFGVPIESVPVANRDFALAQFVFQARRDEAEIPVVIVRAGNEDLETILNGKAGSNDENIF